MSTPAALVIGFFFGVAVTLLISGVFFFWKGATEIHGMDDHGRDGNRW